MGGGAALINQCSGVTDNFCSHCSISTTCTQGTNACDCYNSTACAQSTHAEGSSQGGAQSRKEPRCSDKRPRFIKVDAGNGSFYLKPQTDGCEPQNGPTLPAESENAPPQTARHPATLDADAVVTTASTWLAPTSESEVMPSSCMAAHTAECTYRSARGTCRGHAEVDSLFCSLHKCPSDGCLASKRSTEQHCGHHADALASREVGMVPSEPTDKLPYQPWDPTDEPDFFFPTRLARTLSVTAPPVAEKIRRESRHDSDGASDASFRLPPCFSSTEFDSPLLQLLDVNTLVDVEGHTINWHPQATRLLPLAVMGDGNCLLHAASMAMWGVQDRERTLRRRVASILRDEPQLHERWRQHFARRNRADGFSVDGESQWQDEWRRELELVDMPDAALSELHVFALANVLRRPVLVYADPVARDGAGNPMTPVHLAGLYLPLLYGPTSSSPLALLYHGNHFTPLVAVSDGAITMPICGRQGLARLPVQFALDSEVSDVDLLIAAHLRPEALLDGADAVKIGPRQSQGALGSAMLVYGACLESAFSGEVVALRQEKARRLVEAQEAKDLEFARRLQREEEQRTSWDAFQPIF